MTDEDQVGTPLSPGPPGWFVVGCLALCAAALVGIALVLT